MKSSNKGKDFCVFALPGLFCFLAVVMVPFIYGIYLTLTDWNGVSSSEKLCRTFPTSQPLCATRSSGNPCC